MTYRGHVENGRVIFDEPARLADGTRVTIEVIHTARIDGTEHARTLADRLAPFIGKAKGLQADAAVNHDRYLYGSPEQ